MQLTLCRLRTHQWCFILFNVLLFHALLFGADLLEEYFLRSLPLPYTDVKTLEIRERARKLTVDPLKANLSYTISSAATCSDQEIFLLVLVCSSPENRTRRNVIRQTWGNVTDARSYAVLTLFVLGKPASVATQREISEEAQKHRDIIEGSFIDSPKMQTQKMLMSVEWTVTFCPQARYILKTDEDTFVGIASLAGYLLSLTQLEDVYVGRVVHQGVPNRDPESPGFVPIHQYSEEFYPDYCHGSAFVMSQDVARKVYVAAKEVPVSVPPEIFVGICAKKAGITPIHSSRFSAEEPCLSAVASQKHPQMQPDRPQQRSQNKFPSTLGTPTPSKMSQLPKSGTNPKAQNPPRPASSRRTLPHQLLLQQQTGCTLLFYSCDRHM